MADDDAAAVTSRRRRRRCTDDGMSSLPEHLQHDIFSRVGDVKALFRFAATCRGWLHRFTDPAFLRDLCHGSASGHHHRARLLGVLVQDKSCLVQRAWSACLAPIFSPALGSALGPAGRAVTSLGGSGGGGDDDGTFDDAQPLASRRGIVLLQLAPRTPTPKEKDGRHLFAVCNPVTGDRHVLPPLEWNLAASAGCRTWRLLGYAIITAADSDSGNAGSARFTFSQLLVITQHEYPHRRLDVDARIHSYCAATRRWSAPTACTCLDGRVFSLVGDESAVVHGGAAHWLCIDDCRWTRADRIRGDHNLYKLSVEVATATATARVSLTRLPVRAGDGGEQLLCVSNDDELVVASVYPLHVTVSTPPSTTTTPAALWPRTSFRITPHYHHQHERWFNFNHGSLLALFRGRGSAVFIVDLDTKVMEQVDLDNNTAMGFLPAAKRSLTRVPYEMDLVEFFTTQLGGIRGTTTMSQTETQST